ncbi:MAG: hypothetical protein IH784_10840 [Bacteroidetes bacterium]|nr:hypothetical protein [Bacteroidota bacterium]
MLELNLESFLSPVEDKELNQYKILAQLKNYSELFRKNKLYPSFAQLNQINNLLNSLLSKHPILSVPGSNRKTSSVKKAGINILNGSSENEDASDIIKWAKPLVESLMTEGQAIYEFVHSNIRIESIKPEPSYKDEGYLIIPDYGNLQLLLIEYQRSLFDSNNKPVRSLKTKLLTQISIMHNESAITELGLNLISKYGNLVNPAMFICKTDLDLPFRETIFPIIKSKLISVITQYSSKSYYL